jgi:hypothetical protein
MAGDTPQLRTYDWLMLGISCSRDKVIVSAAKFLQIATNHFQVRTFSNQSDEPMDSICAGRRNREKGDVYEHLGRTLTVMGTLSANATGLTSCSNWRAISSSGSAGGKGSPITSLRSLTECRW